MKAWLKKMMAVSLMGIVALPIGAVFYLQQPKFGKAPEGMRLQRIEESPNYVDGQFQKAGFAPERIHECHGSIHHLQCSANCQDRIWSADVLTPNIDAAACQWQGELPHCPDCGALARPNILMFGDWNWNERRSQAQHERLDAWLEQLPQPPLVLEIGAGRAIATVRHFSERLQRQGSPLLRINPQEVNVHNPKAVEIALGALEALQSIAQQLEPS